MIATLPPVFVVMLDAYTAPPKVVTPVLFNATAPTGVALTPTVLMLIAPLPAFTVSALPEPVTLLENVTAAFVVFNVTSAPKVTAPLYVWMPDVVMLLANVDVPDTVKLDVPAVRVMLLPLTIVKLAIVWATCRSQVALLVITTPVDEDKLPVNFNVPALMFVAPV